jgi:glutamate dehydrogenase/leucine dehydrogenase
MGRDAALETPELHTRTIAGVTMLIAIDSTRLGPALGGCRWRPYPDLQSAATDAAALARAMTRKAALARLSLGGGKAVVIGDPLYRSREQLLALGDFVESLDGRYITAADMGTRQVEMAVIGERTRHVAGLPREQGGCGDPGPYTARGLSLAIEAALAHLGRGVAGARVVVQGAGSVGGALAELLTTAGAKVAVSDPRESALRAELPRELEWIDPGAALTTACDVFAPCGPPFVIDVQAAASLPCQLVCGGANNPLAGPEVARVLDRRGVLYVPDFLANAGGLIHLAVAREGGDAAASERRLRVIPENLAAVLAKAEADQTDPATAAIHLADARVAA